MPSAPLLFGKLFSKSLSNTLRLWKPLFLGFLLYGLVAGTMVILMGSSLFQSLGAMSASEGGPSAALTPSAVIGSVVFFVLLILLGMVFNIGLLDLAVERSPRLRDTLRRIPSLFGTYISAVFWMIVRSWVWIPAVLVFVLLLMSGGDPGAVGIAFPFIFLGFLACGLIFGPRVLFGQLIFIREKVSGYQSVRLSEQRTNRYWGKIVGNWLLLVLILGMIQMGFQLLFGGVLSIILSDGGMQPEALSGLFAAGGVGLLVMFIIVPFLSLFPMVFLTELHDTIKANPRQ